MPKIDRRKAKSYKFDPETIDLLIRLRGAMSDAATGQPRTETDVIRQAVRELARKKLGK